MTTMDSGRRSASDLICPSAQPSMENLHVLGVVDYAQNRPRIAFVRERIPASTSMLAQAAPAAVGEVFRLSGNCEQRRCTHFDGANCLLARRIVKSLPVAGDRLPPCAIRRTCRWHAQEGKAACLRCSQIVTVGNANDALMVEVAGGQCATEKHHAEKNSRTDLLRALASED